MPSSTFLRLRKEKHNAFIEAAMREFAAHDYEAASVSNIVRTLGIAKGSIYQYFEDKWDLYHYLTKTAHSNLLEVVDLVDTRIDRESKLWFIQRVLVEIKFSQELPDESALLFNLKSQPQPKIKSLAQKMEQTEIKSIAKALTNIYDNPVSKELAVTVYAVKEYFIRSLDATRSNHDIANQLDEFANIIFHE